MSDYWNKVNNAECPSKEALLKTFWLFDKYGLIKNDLCFDTEHFIQFTILPKWNEVKLGEEYGRN